MKITQINDPEIVWPYFYTFCIKSKPYDFCQIPSKFLRDKKVRGLFEEFSYCNIYQAEENGKIVGFVFITEEENCLDVSFLFGIRKNFTSPKLIKATHAIFKVALKNCNKNYLKSEIRRKFKVKSYRKWIERYDKTAIIFNDSQNTVVWCNSDSMSVKFKVVGTNKTTEHLLGKEGSLTQSYQKHGQGLLRELLFEDKKYLLDEKSVDFLPSFVLIHGLLSDNEKNVGRVALEFIPQK